MPANGKVQKKIVIITFMKCCSDGSKFNLEVIYKDTRNYRTIHTIMFYVKITHINWFHSQTKMDNNHCLNFVYKKFAGKLKICMI